ncbi:ATP-dependent DNA helicase Q1 [Bufo bufo]|uniref:ATP-dependent DNA helicase Q1 n=1 Tax=Bufo bufo TaxID=8384 RepID=UPI001ABE7B41|nr:ATP-dependent DNA helicase Q1 [Bufo bufo]XP_040293784.1 ATP-dependent DNA helicase Q1 [Bufo bufo]
MATGDLSALVDELENVTTELQAIEVQVQELLERQQELIQRKSALKKKIQRLSEDAEAGTSAEAESSSENWNRQDFSWSQKVKEELQNSFQLDTFRNLQLETINATMAGKDVFLIMPTGGGKSLCYQLPAVSSKGFTLVICPLVSLMEDQLMVLKRLGVSGTNLNAASGKDHVKWVHGEMIDKNSQLKLLYVTPEKIAKSKLFMSRLEKAYQAGRLARIAIDEVHCCSQWGHDFRPDYKTLGILKRQFPNAPLIGLTATATSHVLKDAQKILCVQRPLTFTASFNRPNLFYEVRQKPSSSSDFIEDIVKLINGRYKGQSGIIYCFSQKDSEQVTISLQKLGIQAGTYHANMEARDKTKVHTLWTENKIQVVVATVAFGMGIDKPDVRFVIHHTMSKSMENYYQESGRAGRNDQRADCILYSGFSDIFRISSMVIMENVGQQKLYEMVRYCQDLERCRRVLIAKHFDEVWDSTQCNQMCDNCHSKKSWEKVDILDYGRDIVKILRQADQMDEKLTPLKLIDAWTGKGASKLRVAQVLPPKLPRTELERIISHLLLQKYIREDFSFTAYATISYIKEGPKASALQSEEHSILIHMRSAGNAATKVKSPKFSSLKESNSTHNSPASTTKSQPKKGGGELKRPPPPSSPKAKKSRRSPDASIVID